MFQMQKCYKKKQFWKNSHACEGSPWILVSGKNYINSKQNVNEHSRACRYTERTLRVECIE